MTSSRAVTIDDEDWDRIHWLITAVRNDLVHFVPKGLLVSIEGAREAARAVVRVIRALAFESNMILDVDHEWKERTDRAIQRFDKLIRRVESGAVET